MLKGHNCRSLCPFFPDFRIGCPNDYEIGCCQVQHKCRWLQYNCRRLQHNCHRLQPTLGEVFIYYRTLIPQCWAEARIMVVFLNSLAKANDN